MSHRICTKCCERKVISEFPPDNRAPDGCQSRCRLCVNAWMKEHYRKDPAASMLRRAKARAKKNGWDFDLTIEDLLPLPALCPVFNQPLRLSISPQDLWAYSLDRVHNNQGYVKGNVVVMSYLANRLKNDGTAEQHEAIARWMRSVGCD